MSHVACVCISVMTHTSHVSYERVMSHMNESCLMHMSHATREGALSLGLHFCVKICLVQRHTVYI